MDGRCVQCACVCVRCYRLGHIRSSSLGGGKAAGRSDQSCAQSAGEEACRGGEDGGEKLGWRRGTVVECVWTVSRRVVAREVGRGWSWVRFACGGERDSCCQRGEKRCDGTAAFQRSFATSQQPLQDTQTRRNKYQNKKTR